MADTHLTITLDLDRRGASRQAQAFRAEQRQLAQGLLADELAAERAREELARKESRAKVQAARQAGDAMSKATKQAASDATVHFGAIGKAGRGAFAGLGKAVGSFALQMVGLDSAQAVVGAIVSNFELARQSAYKASQMVNDYRESLLELAALKGKLGNTTEATKEEIAFRAQTLQTPAAARDFQLAALGVGESAVGAGKNISRAEWEKALVQAGAFQATEGGSADAHGSLVGLIATLAKGPITGEDLFRKEQQLYKIMQPGGFSFSSGIQQFAKLAPLVKSGVFKDTDLAAILSGFSTTNREGAGENVMQFTRATIGAIGKMSGVRIEGAEKVGQYLKSLGVTDDFVKHTEATQLPFAIGNKISEDLDRARAEAASKGEEFNPAVYIKHKGYGNQEDAAALLQYYGLKQTGALDKTFLPLAAPGAMPTAAEAMAPIERARNNDPALMARRSAFAVEAANIAVGAGQPEYLAALKEGAFARLRAKGEIPYEKYSEVQQLGDFSPTEILFGYRKRVDQEAQRMLMAEAARVGVASPTYGNGQLKPLNDDELNAFAVKVKAAGGKALPGLDEVTNKALTSLSASQAFEQIAPAPQAAAAVGGDMKQTNQLLQQIATNTAAKPQAPRPLVGAPPARTR